MKEKFSETENIEIELLLEGIYRKYGYDFRGYARASVWRRIQHRLARNEYENVSELQHYVLNDEQVFQDFMQDISINVTEMFRNPPFYKALRELVIPELKKLPFIKIWHAGCATGEEVYSMAILLKEEGLYDKTQIYATDFNEIVIRKAKDGVFPVKKMKQYTTNYLKAGGEQSFANYYTAKYDFALMDKSLKTNILFSDHNLTIDGVFGEMDMILCRNVMIYFDRDLQIRVTRLFRDSLGSRGFLCLGANESIRFLGCYEDFDNVSKKEKIYRKREMTDNE